MGPLRPCEARRERSASCKRKFEQHRDTPLNFEVLVLGPSFGFCFFLFYFRLDVVLVLVCMGLACFARAALLSRSTLLCVLSELTFKLPHLPFSEVPLICAFCSSCVCVCARALFCMLDFGAFLWGPSVRIIRRSVGSLGAMGRSIPFYSLGGYATQRSEHRKCAWVSR